MGIRNSSLRFSKYIRSQYFLILLDQILLGLVSTSSSLIAYVFFDNEDLANFVFYWTLLWGFVAILSEALVNPLRVIFNTSIKSKSDFQEIANTRSVLAYASTFLLLISIIIFRSENLSAFISSISLALSVTAYSMGRNLFIDTRNLLGSICRATSILLVSLGGMGFCILILNFKTSAMFIVISSAYILPQSKLFFINFRSLPEYLLYSLKIIFSNAKFGLSTMIRIVLFSTVIMFILRQNFPQKLIIEYGLILSLSNLGLFLTTALSQLEFKKLSLLRNTNNLRNKINHLIFQILMLSILGSGLGFTLGRILSLYSSNYNTIIDSSGEYKIALFSFLCIFFIGLSNLLSNVTQILGLGNLQLVSILSSGLIGIFVVSFAIPDFATFLPYAFYVIICFILITLNRKHYATNHLHR